MKTIDGIEREIIFPQAIHHLDTHVVVNKVSGKIVQGNYKLSVIRATATLNEHEKRNNRPEIYIAMKLLKGVK